MKVNKICEICEKRFNYYNTTYPNRRFCSKKCDSIAKKTERLGMKFSDKHRKNIGLSHIDKIGYWIGKKRSKEDIEKFRKSHLGKKQSKETILKRIKRGKDHYNYQGGITPLTRRRTRGTFWKQIADKVRKRDNNICRLCGFKGNGKKLPVHHIIPFKISKDNDSNNLISLCQSCHIKLDNPSEDRGDWTKYFKEKIGGLIR